MKIYYPVPPDQVGSLDTVGLRSRFLIDSLFVPGEISSVYVLEDRMLIFGAVPTNQPLTAEIARDITGTQTLLARREMGIINIGGPGSIESGGQQFAVANRHVLYLGRESEAPRFTSDDPGNPARFYAVCVPAHATLPAAVAGPGDAEVEFLGSAEKANLRTLYKYIHPNGIKSAQLVMGWTELKLGSVWNTMPAHTHLRRTEAYLYFDVPPDDVVMHFMGAPDETRHLVVHDQEAVISPSWSLHGGSGTASYRFIWAMAGENQDFTDMDHITLTDLS
jgi:4-deoxy-L-threo-5-hexosulose-uronate ketol-isomerase